MALRIIVGESHDLESYYYLNTIIGELNKHNMLDLLLQENAFNFRLLSKSEVEEKIQNKQYMLGDLHYQLAIDHKLPVIGIDLPIKTPKEDDLVKSFKDREKRMLKVIKEESHFSNCLLIVGDTHLRSFRTKELGDASPLYEEYKTNRDTYILRANVREIDVDRYPAGTISYDDFFKLIKTDRFINQYKRRRPNTKIGKW